MLPATGVATTWGSPIRKVVLLGTHRAAALTETLARYLPLAEAMGITRLANVTGLDHLGVPVFLAMRPNARSLSVAQGKGFTHAAAKASALMEAAETYHAEHVGPTVPRASICDLPHNNDPIDWKRLPQLRTREFSPEAQTAWIEGRDLFTDTPIWVPHDLVHTNYVVPFPDTTGFFPLSSTGLASGNTRCEAICVALMELIERDAITLWSYRTTRDKAARRIDLETIEAGPCRDLLDRLQRRGMLVTVWDITTDVGVAAFLCQLEERSGTSRSPLVPFHGAGCHLAREVAFIRAVTEAAQTRLTYIAGSRDDLRRRDYSQTTAEAVMTVVSRAWEARFPARQFADVPNVETEVFEEDLQLLLECLAAVGCRQVVAVDLTRADFELPVVRMVVPGLEFDHDDPDHSPGERAERMAAQQKWRA